MIDAKVFRLEKQEVSKSYFNATEKRLKGVLRVRLMAATNEDGKFENHHVLVRRQEPRSMQAHVGEPMVTGLYQIFVAHKRDWAIL